MSTVPHQCRVWAVVWLAGALAAPVATAEVIEITPNGAVIRHHAPPVAAPGAQVSAPAEARRQALAPAFDHSGAVVGLSPELLEAVAWAESRFNPDARSPKGAQGVMQLMPGTAAELGVDPTVPQDNIRGGARYLRQMLETFDGDLELALAAYNAGPGAVRRHGGVPPYPETRRYVAAVLDYMAGRVSDPAATEVRP